MIIAIPSPGLIMSSAVSSSDDFLIPFLWRRVANVATTPDHYSLFQQATSAPVSLLTDSTFLWVSHICWWDSISRDTLKISRRNCIFQPWLLKPLSILFCNFQSHHSNLTLFFWLLAKKLSIWSSFEKFFEFVFQLDFYFHVHLFPFLLPTIESSACLLVFAFSFDVLHIPEDSLPCASAGIFNFTWIPYMKHIVLYHNLSASKLFRHRRTLVHNL